MSKIGQKTIEVPPTVQLTIDGKKVTVKGPNGEYSVLLPKSLDLKREGNILTLTRSKEDKKTKSLHGLFRQLIFNAVTGVEKLWQKRLEVVGTGFNVKLQGDELVFKLGYSHPVIFKKIAGIKYQVEGNTKVVVQGLDKQLVGQVSFQIKMLRKPDVYKGKGIRYEGEKLRIKPGKKAKAAGTTAAA